MQSAASRFAGAAPPEDSSAPSPSAKPPPGKTWQRQNGAYAAAAEEKVLDWHAGWESDGSGWEGPLAEVIFASRTGPSPYPVLVYS